MSLLLGIDIGTSSAKAILFDSETGATAAAAGREYPILRPAPDRAEQRPEDWWAASVEVARRVLADADGRAIAAISLTGQMHGLVLLDAHGIPLGDAIIWNDQRAVEQVRELVEPFGGERFTAIAGTLPAAGFMGASLLWIKRHLPGRLEQTSAVLFPKDYVRYRLTGEIAAEPSDAASSALFDVNAGVWSDAIIGAVGLPRAIFPPIIPSSALVGGLTKTAAAALGLREGLPVIAGCGDQPAQALANGILDPGRVSITVGSGGQVFSPLLSAARTDPRLHVFNHAVPERWYALGATLSAGLSLRWLRALMGMASQPDAYARFSHEAGQTPPGANGLIFLPHLTGERTPHLDPLARGAFIGLTAYHERRHLARAVMEGVAFSLRQALELTLVLGGQAGMIIAAGGGMESDVWRGILADVVGVPLQRALLTETTGVGAALLAGIGIGIYRDAHHASQLTARFDCVTEPNPANRAVYNELYAQFLSLYPALRADFHRLSKLN